MGKEWQWLGPRTRLPGLESSICYLPAGDTGQVADLLPASTSCPSFNKYLLNVYCVPGTVSGTEDLAVDKTDTNLCLCGEGRHKRVNQ